MITIHETDTSITAEEFKKLIKPFDHYFTILAKSQESFRADTSFQRYVPGNNYENSSSFYLDFSQLPPHNDVLSCHVIRVDVDHDVVSKAHIKKIEKLYRDCFSKYGRVRVVHEPRDSVFFMHANYMNVSFTIRPDERLKFFTVLKTFLTELFKIGKDISLQRDRNFGRGSKL